VNVTSAATLTGSPVVGEKPTVSSGSYTGPAGTRPGESKLIVCTKR